MRRVILLSILIFILVNPVSAYSFSGYYTNLQGNIVDFNTFEGDYVLVEAFAVGCYYCEQQHPILVQIYNEYRQDIRIK